MDETLIAKWVIEFLLRRRIDDKIVNDVISSLPPVTDDHRLKKTILLRRIETETSNCCVSEKLLGLFEIIEGLDNEKGKTASDLMKEAYCLVAVDCTVRFLVDDVKYLEVVENLWKNRVFKSKGLVSEMSKSWLEDIEAALGDKSVYESIWARNTRNEALKAVKDYLKEAWDDMGPPFLELVADKVGNEVTDLCGDDHNPCRQLMVAIQVTQNSPARIRRKHVAVKNRRQKLAVVSDVADKDAVNNDGDDTAEMVVPDGNCKPQTLSSTEQRGHNNVLEAEQMGSKVLESNEVVKVRRALRNNRKELHAVVNDPLPEALQTAETLMSLRATNNHKISEQNQTVSDIPTIPEGTETDAPSGSNENDLKNGKQDNSIEDPRGQMMNHRITKNGRKRSLIDLNDASHNDEWDEEIENSSSGSPSRPRLSSPKVLRSSPLKIEHKNVQRRRERKRWAPPEEDTLKEGVRKYGRGNWKAILSDAKFGEALQGRTEVDLKDKWRNIVRYSYSSCDT